MTLSSIDRRSTILRLRAAIRSQETAARALRAEIVTLAPQGPATGPARSGLWQEKRTLGATTRTMLLALAMVRGRAYARVEQHPRTGFDTGDVALHILGLTVDDLYGSQHDLPAGREARDAVIALRKDVDAWTKVAEAPCMAPTVPSEAAEATAAA